MKIAHWVDRDLRSGLGHVALHISEAEKKAGLKSVIIDANLEANWPNADDADIQVVHLFMPPKFIYRNRKPLVWMAHGTPEVMLESAREEAATSAYAHGDRWMIAQWWLQHADVTVTFWPRHEAIWRSLSDKHTRIEGVPLGVDLAFWKSGDTWGKFQGAPSVFSAENCYTIKWPLDLFIAWPWVVEQGLPDARLHCIYVPESQHRFWFPLVNRNGTSFHSYISSRVFNPEELRNAFISTDYYIGLVRYGDHNYIGQQANAANANTISYPGNPYSAYWIDAGDQRIIAQQLSAIFRGEVEARRDREKPVDISRTVERLKEIYLSLSGEPKKPKRKLIVTPKTDMVTEAIQ